MPIPIHRPLTTVAPAATGDAEIIHAIAIAANIGAWSPGDYCHEVQRPDSIVLKAETNGTLNAFLVARIVPGTSDRADAELYNIAVSSEYRRNGIGSRLLNSLRKVLSEQNVRCIWLEVRESNHSAIDFYRKHGFVVEAKRPNFYSNPVGNALIMRCELDSAPRMNFE